MIDLLHMVLVKKNSFKLHQERERLLSQAVWGSRVPVLEKQTLKALLCQYSKMTLRSWVMILYKYIWGIISNVEKLLRDNMEIDQIDINQS